MATAETALRAAMEYAAGAGLRVSVAVVDHRGVDVALRRADGATWFTPEVARAKARTAATFGRSSASVGQMKEDHPELYGLVVSTLAWTATTLPGGLPLVNDGQTLGAVGVSGAHPDDDVRAAQYAVDAVTAQSVVP